MVLHLIKPAEDIMLSHAGKVAQICKPLYALEDYHLHFN